MQRTARSHAQTEDGTTMTRQQDVELTVALAGTLAAMGEAARQAGGGVRTVGRRAARTGTGVSRRVLASAADSGHRANIAFHVYRGDREVYRRRPAEYVAAGVVAGLIGAFAIAAIARALIRRPDGDPARTRVPDRLETVRSAARRGGRPPPVRAGAGGGAPRGARGRAGGSPPRGRGGAGGCRPAGRRGRGRDDDPHPRRSALRRAIHADNGLIATA